MQLAKQAEPLDPINGAMVVRALKSIDIYTALGIDQWGHKDFKDLPMEVWESLAELLNSVERAVAWPAHILYNIIVHIGKPTGGTRPIALTPMLYRMWTKLGGPIS